MDVRYINPFILAVKDVFSTMLSTDLLISKPFIRSAGDQVSDVSAVIGLSGDAVGTVALCFPARSAENAASKFAGVELATDHEDFSDALGELANMVAGSAKAKFDGVHCNISLPSVFIGKDMVISQASTSPTLALPCDSALGRFSVEVGMSMVNHSGEAGAASIPVGSV